MINGRTVLGIVPARAGSKGLPGKNIRILHGKPLLVWTVEVALKSTLLDKVVVSTDCATIAAIARDAGATVPFIRPAALARDDSPTVPVIEHALDYFRDAGELFDYVVLLEPTSPLRADDDIDNALERLDLRRADYDAIVSVGEVRDHPSLMMRSRSDSLEPFCTGLEIASRRQDQEPAWYPYGVIYAVKTTILLTERTFFPSRCTYYPIQRYQNHEIDDEIDFEVVASIMRNRDGKP
jgi:CMP-N,N'-diacetyllegionaminic acid synthase